MIYHMIKIFVYIISVILAMIGLSCFDFEKSIKRSKVKEFYIFFLVASVALGYLFASFILNFAMESFIYM